MGHSAIRIEAPIEAAGDRGAAVWRLGVRLFFRAFSCVGARRWIGRGTTCFAYWVGLARRWFGRGTSCFAYYVLLSSWQSWRLCDGFALGTAHLRLGLATEVNIIFLRRFLFRTLYLGTRHSCDGARNWQPLLVGLLVLDVRTCHTQPSTGYTPMNNSWICLAPSRMAFFLQRRLSGG